MREAAQAESVAAGSQADSTELSSDADQTPSPSVKPEYKPPWVLSREARARGHVLPSRGALPLALKLAEHEFRVVLLWPGIKIPYGDCWPELATRDRDAVREKFSWLSKANLGLLMGDNGLFAIDIDPRNGGSLERLREILDIPETAIARTGSGGYHIVLRDPDATKVIHGADEPFGLPGIEIKGYHQQIVVEPSIHPDTGVAYRWLIPPWHVIATAPEKLLAELDRLGARRPRQETELAPRRAPAANRVGNDDWLLEEMLARFPVPGPGKRFKLMRRAVGNLVGRGFRDDQILRVMDRWHEYHVIRKLCRTGPETAAGELRVCLRCTRQNPQFTAAVAAVDHAEMRAAMELEPWQKRALDQVQIVTAGDGPALWVPESVGLPEDQLGNPDSDSTHSPCHYPHSKTVTHIECLLCDRDLEKYFLEQLIILVTYKRLRSCELRIELTHGQIQREIFRRRGQWLDPTQIQRLKRKFITFKNHQPGKPDHQAERFELLREIDKGSRSQKGRLGKPSAFECTGLNYLLASEARLASGYRPTRGPTNA